jgi:ectoine hydroxylase
MLSATQLSQYSRDGFLILEDLFTPEEVEVLSAETARLSAIETPLIKRERSGAARSIMASHATGVDTASPAFLALSRSPRVLGPVCQILATNELYVHHSKINVKQAFVGGIYSWHQDFGTWQRDGIQGEEILTVMVMLDDAAEISGALYFVPGSHRAGTITHVEDAAVGALNPWSVDRHPLAAVLERTPPVPVLGRAGTTVIFHSNLVHGSGHNMSSRDRRQVYLVYNPLANRPAEVGSPRPEFVCSRACVPVTPGLDGDLLAAGR